MTARTLTVQLKGRTIALALRRSSRARRIAIRVDPALGGAELVLPADVLVSAGRAFVVQRSAWLLARLDRIPALVPFQAGASIPYRGAPRHIVHDPAAWRGVHLADDRIVVSGWAEHLGRGQIRDAGPRMGGYRSAIRKAAGSAVQPKAIFPSTDG